MNTKFCPRCRTINKLSDAYCLKCGYAFRRARKNSLITIIFVIILLIIGWIAFRTFTNQPIIPAGLSNIFQNSTLNLTK